MKVITWLMFQSTFVVLTIAVRSTIYAPLNVITLDDITPDERRQIAFFEEKLKRAKRSGSDSGSILNVLKSAIGNGIKNKLGQLATASAAASGAFSRTSSSSHGKEYHHYHSYPDHDHHHHEEHEAPFDFWNIKKSVLNTLLQAVKAIKGGVIAVKGQLIKGGGKLVSASGHIVSAQGDAITKLGKHIATSAVLVPFKGSSHKEHSHDHEEYAEVDHHYPSPSGPGEYYQSIPSGPSVEHYGHSEYSHREDPGGLLILKKIRRNSAGTPQNYPRESRDSGSFLGKLFSASTSLDPDKPQLYGEEPQVHNSHNHYELVPSASTNNQQKTAAPADYNPSKGVKEDSKTYKIYQDSFKNKHNAIPQNYIKSSQGLSSYSTNEFTTDNLFITPTANTQKTYQTTKNKDAISQENYVKPSYNNPEYTKPLSIYLETPKLPDTDETNLNQQDSFQTQFDNFNYQISSDQNLVDLVPSISYELQQSGNRRIT